MTYTGISRTEDFRLITRAHVLAWRTALEDRYLSGATIRRKLAALSSLFDYLCDHHAATSNPVRGGRRLGIDCTEGKTPALAEHEARALLDAPNPDTLKGRRDRAQLVILLYHGLRRAELCFLQVQDILPRRGMLHLWVRGKGGKLRYLTLHPTVWKRLSAYLSMTDHVAASAVPLFQPMRATGAPLTPDGVYKIAQACAAEAGLTVPGLGVHGLRTTAATFALEHGADLAAVQAWLGHARISTTRLYDRRQHHLENSPSPEVKY